MAIEGHYEEALEACLQGCRLTENAPAFLLNAAAVCQHAGWFDKAIGFYQQLLSARPLDFQANLQLATTYTMAGRHLEAQKQCRQMLEVFPDNVETFNILSESLLKSGNWDEAFVQCESGIALQSHHPFLWFRRGLLLSYFRRFTEADASFRQAEQLQLDVASAYFQGIKYDPDLIAQLNPRLFYMEMASELAAQGDMRLWGHFSNVLAEYLALTPISDIRRTLAFRVFGYPVSPELRLRLMQRISLSASCSTEKLYGEHAYQYHGEVRTQLRIGYISADFYQHPTSILTRQLYRLHDRLKFRVYAYAIVPSPRKNDGYRAEISENCDVFRDVSDMSDLQIADIINADGIDILVDLGQYATVDGRLGVLSLRPAPVQINYLAFMATTGADFIDYAMVDHHIVPDDRRNDWTEKLIRLPDSLFLFDNQISHAPTQLTRASQGLPEDVVVFCCFNNDYKIDPEIFTAWMNILREVPDSVLWLLGSNDQVKTNLRKAALQQGIFASRLIFGGRIELNLHMQRYQLADIFLDTYWFNGHTTTLEALWQGLPVLTRRGDVSSSRVAASFLEVLGLQELITDNYTDYQQKAVLYAKNPQLRHDLKQRLLQARQTSGLFNTHQKVRQIELAYEMAWSRHHHHMEPLDINIPNATNLRW